MKRSFTLRRVFNLLPLLFILTQSVKAQGNLKFSQVKYLSLSGNALYNGPSSVQTAATQNLVVSPNHVVKIENILGVNLDISLPYGYSSFLIDDAICARSNTTVTVAFPIWLSSGTYTLKLNYYNTSPCTGSFCSPTPYPIKATVSAIDFEVTP